ncbi:MAG: zinc ABC transporter substrate-binding protein [Candidatus Thalassarchaeum sp.]|nr:zinc ABC transporter substrate-binding protein [Candidatus Thalassarchaeum sp.]
MKTNWHRAILLSLLMIFSSLAGCLEDDSSTDDSSDNNDSDINSDTGNNTTNQTVIPDYGNIMVSTYHIAQLVSAIVGPTANVEMMSTSNIPVHDYKPSLQDTVRLSNSDVFFYHGLNLEPWVGETLSILGSEAPPAYATHTMPTGEATPDFQSLLVSDLCKQLNEGERVSNTLMSYESQASELEIHLERGVQTLTFPGADAASLQGHDHDDDHDNHTEEGHDDHDNHTEEGHDVHEEHAHAEAEKVIENPTGCPADTVISILHLEEGEHIVEFETDYANLTSFDVAALPMLGGHAHHDHGDHGDDGHDDHSGHDDHGDDGHDDHGDDGHDDHGDDGHGDGAFEWAGIFEMNDNSHTWSMQKVGGAYADPTMRLVLIPTDSPNETTMHTLESDAETLITGDSCTIIEDGESMSPVATGSCFELHVGTGDDSTFTINTTGLTGMAMYAQHVPTEFERDQHYLKDTAGTDIEPIAQEGAGAHGHDDHHAEYPICHNTETHENMEGTNQSDCETAGHLWMEGEPNDGTLGFLTIHVENEGDYGFALPSHITAHILLGEGGHDDHDDHAGHDDHSGHDDHGDDTHDDHGDEMVCYDMSSHTVNGSYDNQTACESAGLMWTSANSGPGGDDHGDEGAESEIVANEDEFEYDPHSWLDPVAFKAQVNLVLNALIEQFPEGNETFTANAQEFMIELDRLHLGYVDAFGPSSTCTSNLVAANHNAYSYLTVRYGIEFVTVHGLDPEGEPSVEDVAEVIEKINEDQITVLFIEEYTLRSAVDSIVDSTGVQVLYLYTMEMSPSDDSDTYLTMMNKNLENLKIGMGCTA